MIVKLKQNAPHPADLSASQLYFVIGIEADDYRLLNDAGEPFLYAPDLFEIVDDAEPDDWINEIGADGERYAYPDLLNKPGFFEDYFEHKPEQAAIFWHVVNRRLAQAA